MSYPRLLKLDADTKQRLISYINEELTNHNSERQQAIDELKQFQTDYWAKPSSERKTFPFTGAANIIVPLTAIAVETIHARTMQTLFAVDPIVSILSRNAQLTEFETPLEDHLHYELMEHVGARRGVDSCVLELEKFGTGIGKSGYERIVKYAVRPSPDGSANEEEFPVIVKDGATLDPVPNANFLMPYGARDPQTAPWCGEEHSRTPYEVLLLEQSGLFRAGLFEELKSWMINAEQNQATNAKSRQYEQHVETLEKRVPNFPKRLNWVELWMSFNVDGGKTHKEIVVHFHPDSQKLMAVRYNWYVDLHRPYRTGVYMPVENRWRGIGICKQNEQFQRSVTTRHRQSLDSGTIANMQMFKVHKLSGYGPKEPIFPGKMWFLDDMSYIEPMQMGGASNVNFALEQSDLIFSQMRTGVNEATLGMPQAGTPGTATSDLSRIQESQKKFDFFYSNIKDFVSGLYFDVFCNIHQFGPRNVDYFVWAEHGDKLRQLYTLPLSVIRDGLVFAVAASGAKQNRLQDRQNWTQVAQVLQQYYAGMLQLAQLSQNPQLIQLVMTKGLSAATEAMRQILESFDIRNIDRLVLSELENMASGGGNGGPANRPNALPVGGGGAGPTGNGQVQGMDRLAQIVALLGSNGAQGLAGL